MQQRGSQQGFGPVFSPSARALILGSYPSPKSFAAGFYYGHPQNRFWPLLAAFAGVPVPVTTAEKTDLILKNNLALWDSLARCSIIGAADVSITDPVPNDIAALLAGSHIQAIFCNGAAAHRFYTQFCLPQTGLPACKLPSTSPANAAFSLERLQAAWAPVAAYMPQNNAQNPAVTPPAGAPCRPPPPGS